MTQKRKNHRKIYLMLFVVIFVVAAMVGYFMGGLWVKNDDREENADGWAIKQDTQNEEVDAGMVLDEKMESKVENQTTEDEEVFEKKVVQYEGEDPNKAEELSGAITYAGVNGENLMVRANVDQYLTQGECELTLLRGGDTIYSSIADIISSVATSTCDGFDVPVAELGGGDIEIIINLSADERVGTLRGKASI